MHKFALDSLLSLSVTIELHGQEAYHFQTDYLERYVVMSAKIEIRLAEAGNEHWVSLEFNRYAVAVREAIASALDHQRTIYPSSKPKRLDSDKLEAEVKKEGI